MMRRSQTLGRYVVGLRPTVRHVSVLRPSVAAICVLGAACVFGSRPPSPLRGYRLVIEGRDSLSDYLAAALADRGFTVRRRLKGGSAPAAALVTFTYRELGPSPITWFNVRLADTRSGAIVAAVSAPLDSLGATERVRARSLADSLAARLSHPETTPP